MFDFNGKTPKKILYNGLNVAKLVFNGIVVWMEKLPTSHSEETIHIQESR